MKFGIDEMKFMIQFVQNAFLYIDSKVTNVTKQELIIQICNYFNQYQTNSNKVPIISNKQFENLFD